MRLLEWVSIGLDIMATSRIAVQVTHKSSSVRAMSRLAPNSGTVTANGFEPRPRVGIERENTGN